MKRFSHGLLREKPTVQMQLKLKNAEKPKWKKNSHYSYNQVKFFFAKNSDLEIIYWHF